VRHGNAALKLGEALFDPILFRNVDELVLSVRARHCLKNAGVVHIGDLVQLPKSHFVHTPNMSRKALVEIKDELAGHRLKLGTELSGGHVKFADIV